MMSKLKTDLLDYNLYLTRGWSDKDVKNIAENSRHSRDLYTGLRV
jgi:hypothetical protein